MDKPIYYSRIEFREYLGYFREEYNLLIDLVNKEITYQEFSLKRNMPSAIGPTNEEFLGRIVYREEQSFPMKKMRDGKNDFKPTMVMDESLEQIVTFTYGIKLSDEEYENLLPYCNALDFEPYRNKEMRMDDPGFCGYRDEVQMYFTAITDSYIPKIDLPMTYYYDEAHIWPSEKLYRYLVKTFFMNKKDKQLRGRKISWYGGSSLFC